MATNIYKVGGCIYIHDSAADLDTTDFPTISYSGFKTMGDEVYIYNHIVSTTDNSNTTHSIETFQSNVVLIADVRDSTGSVIGDGGKAAVRDYLANLL